MGESLTTDNYSIDLASGGAQIFVTDSAGDKEWVATAGDPQIAIDIVEGLLLVRAKRFYHPESSPVFETKIAEKSPVPPFLRK